MHSSNSIKTLLSALFLTTAPYLQVTQAAYTLKDDYTASTFFSQFTFFTDADPTHGYVDYQSQSAATSANLINTNNNQIFMGVDSSSVATGRGRKSVRITSKNTYNHALIILDLDHMPGSICGVWPAFWTVGPNWPTAGEIDIIEGVNGQVGNSMALHTGPGCSVSGGSGGTAPNTSPNNGGSSAQALFSGTLKTPNCDVAASGQATNAGCAITSSDASTYGSGLNSANGGVYATEWTSGAISVWFFPRGSIPADIDSGSPTPSSWGAPMASFGGGSCNIDNSFKDQQIVFDTTFCGDWAGQVWNSDATCSSKAATCQEYVQNNPNAFKDAYWAVNHLKVYTGGDSGAVPSASASASVSRSVGTGMPTGIPPIGTGSATATSPGFGSGIPSMSVSTPTAGKPQPTTPATTTVPGFTPQPSSGNPNVPTPTTMYTSSRTSAWNNPNANTNSWQASNTNNNGWGGRTRTRGWGGGPPRMAKFAAIISEHEHGAEFAGPVEARSASLPEQTGVSEREMGVQVRSLVAPVVRRGVDGEDGVDEEAQVGRREARRSHLGRHKERRHGWGV